MKANNKWRRKKIISNNQTRQSTSRTVTMNQILDWAIQD